MPELSVFDEKGNFTSSFKFKIAEYLRAIPLSDDQVEALTRSLTIIVREAVNGDSSRIKQDFSSRMKKIETSVADLKTRVESSNDQTLGMTKTFKLIAGVIGFMLTCVLLYSAFKPDPTQSLMLQLLKEVKHANISSP